MSPHFSKNFEIAIIPWKCDKMLKNVELYHSQTTKLGPYLHICPSKVAIKVQWPSGF